MEDDLKKNKKWKTTSKKNEMEDNLKKIKNGRRPQKKNKKMEDKPINQNQPNWL
jgi:hypothetical protein